MYLVIVVVLILIYLVSNRKVEGFSPQATEVFQNPNIFQVNKYKLARSKYPWLDIVSFEDLRHLKSKGTWDLHTINQIITV